MRTAGSNETRCTQHINTGKKAQNTKRKAIIVDMDGTLVNVDSILHHVKGVKKDFTRFHSESINCPPHVDVVEMVKKFKLAGNLIIVVSAREERWRALTSFWLALNAVPSDVMFLRPTLDFRSDVEIKREIYEHIAQIFKVVHAIDDNPVIIELWKSLGIPVTKIGAWET